MTARFKVESDITMRIRHELDLPQREGFYTKNLAFEVKVNLSVCGPHFFKGKTFTLEPPTLLSSHLSGVDKSIHRVSLEAISEAALRFYSSENRPQFSTTEYIDHLFWTRYQWGLAFEESTKGSLRHRPRTVLHSEALRALTEQFAYGLSIHFVAKLLGVPTDRFFFIDAAGARADFQAKLTSAELLATHGGNIGVLDPNGYRVLLEVKARTGWADYRTGKNGLELLENLSHKTLARPDYVTISLVIALPNKTLIREPLTRILIADPGEPIMLNESDQVVLLLEEAIPLLVRHGLWPTLSSALDWLEALGVASTQERETLLPLVEAHKGRRQYVLVTEIRDGRTFNGRIFSDVTIRLGRTGDRSMSLEEAERRLQTDDLGRAWFSGADVEWIKIIQARNAEALLSYGLKLPGQRDLSGQSAFTLFELPITEEIRAGVRDSLKSSLRRW